MSTLLSRIMLALLMLPLGALVYCVVIVTSMEISGYAYCTGSFLLTDLVTAIFIATYWTLLWRRTVSWNVRRVTLSIAAAGAAAAVGAITGLMVRFVDTGFGVFIGGVTTILLWLALTVFIWTETRAERVARVAARSASAMVCPSCGYNLTGLRQTICPECGASYTIDELAALQPAREKTEL